MASEMNHEHEAQAMLAAIVESSDDAIIGKTLEGMIFSWNKGAERIYGYTWEEAMRKNISFLVPPGRPDEIPHILEAIGHGEYVHHYETERLTKDGRVIQVSLSVSPIRDSAGNIVGASSIARDITERKQAEKLLQEREERFRMMANALPQLAWIARPDGYIYWYNQRWYDYTGTTPDQMAGWGWQNVHDPNALPKVLERWQASIATGQPFDMEFPLLGADGRFRLFLTRVQPVKDDEGRVLQWVGTNTDVTELRKAQEELAELAELLDLAHVIIRDPENKITYWNTGDEQLYGYTKDEAIGRISHELFRTVFPESREAFDRALVQTGHWQGELVHTAKDGHRVVVASHQVLRCDEEGQPVAILEVNNDTTALREVREELQRINDTLEERVQARTAALETSNKELEAFSYSVAHDLRSPLRSVDGFSQYLLEHYAEQLDARGQDYLLRMRTAAQRMGRLIDDLLNLMRISRVEVRKEQVDLSALAAELLDELRRRDPERRVTVDIAPGLIAIGDRGLFRVALGHLLDNAWKFTSKQEDAHITMGTMDREGERIYYIRDNGVGFDMTYVNKLFQPFQRLHTEEEFPGTGIGLAVVRRVIERHGGHIWAEGVEGRGTTIFFTLGDNSDERGNHFVSGRQSG